MDGFAALWVASNAIGRNPDYVEFRPVFYGGPPPKLEEVAGHRVLILDFSYPRETLLAMKEAAVSLSVFDHHKTAEKELADLDFCTFDMNRSGAGITADHFGGRNWIVNYVEDRDLWRFALPSSDAVNLYLQSLPKDFDVWDRVLAEGVEAAIKKGHAIVDYRDQLVEQTIAGAKCIRFFERDVVTASCSTPGLVSEAGARLLRDYPLVDYAALYSVQFDKVTVSLRSRPGGVNVGEIAKMFGGGGHINAAGFVVNRKVIDFESMK